MSGWHWQTWQGRPYLTCDLLASWTHGFFTRHWSPASPKSINQALAPEASVYHLKQVHGDRVLVAHSLTPASEMHDPGASPPPADGLVACQSNQSIWVATADCVPVLIGDRRLGSVAAIHAGWRGTAQGIVPLAVAKLQQQGSQLHDLQVALGPAIAGPMYQVSTAVAARVGATLVSAPSAIDAVSIAPPSPHSESAEEAAPDVAIQEVLAQLSQIPQSPVTPDPQPNRVRLDVRRVNQLQLEQMGIATAQIAVAPHCTYRDGDRFFSYRREALKKVQWSGIVSG